MKTKFVTIITLWFFGVMSSNLQTEPNKTYDKIVGGAISEFAPQWIALIRWNTNGDGKVNVIGDTVCTGSLVHKNPPIVLTAAHCFKGKYPNGTTYDFTKTLHVFRVDLGRRSLGHRGDLPQPGDGVHLAPQFDLKIMKVELPYGGFPDLALICLFPNTEDARDTINWAPNAGAIPLVKFNGCSPVLIHGYGLTSQLLDPNVFATHLMDTGLDKPNYQECPIDTFINDICIWDNNLPVLSEVYGNFGDSGGPNQVSTDMGWVLVAVSRAVEIIPGGGLTLSTYLQRSDKIWMDTIITGWKVKQHTFPSKFPTNSPTKSPSLLPTDVPTLDP